jgi:hypothetical protein
MTEAEEKAAFAVGLLKQPNDPFKVALSLFPDNTNRALWVAHNWPHDAEVKAEQERLANEDGGDFLPSKADLARAIWQKMEGTTNSEGRVIVPTTEDYAKLAKLYAEVRGFIEKPGTGPQVNVIVPRAIEVPTHGSNEAWEAAAEIQQRELLNVSRSRH